MHQFTRGITRVTGETELPLMCQVTRMRNVCSEEKVGTGFNSRGIPCFTQLIKTWRYGYQKLRFCNTIHRKSGGEKIYKYLWCSTIINTIFSFSLYSQNNIAFLTALCHFVFRVNRCKRSQVYLHISTEICAGFLMVSKDALPCPVRSELLAFLPFPSAPPQLLTSCVWSQSCAKWWPQIIRPSPWSAWWPQQTRRSLILFIFWSWIR